MAMSSSRDTEKQLQDPGGGSVQIPAPISSTFCLPNVSELRIVESAECCGDCRFQVMDLEGSVLFRYSNCSFWSSDQVLHDDHGRVLATLKQKSFGQLKWNVYRGNKPHTEEDLLFRIVKSKVKRRRTFDILLPGKDEPDFTFILKYSKTHRYAISHRDVIVAEAKKISKFFKPSEIIVTANPGVDRAFVASVLVMERVLAGQEQGRSSAAVRGPSNWMRML